MKNPSWLNAGTGLFILRIGVGVLFLVHGIAKFSDISGTAGFFGMIGLPAFMAYVIAFIETVGGIALILGVYTRIASVLLAAVMIGAYFSVKLGKPFMGGWELDFILFMASVTILASGPGSWALKKRATQSSPVL
ncbi:MAG: DoxX family protein [Patescibacteria group bacterium]